MKDYTQNSEALQFQPTLFDQNDELETGPRSNYVGEDAAEQLLVALLSLNNVEGLGLKTLQLLFDANIVHHLNEWTDTELREHIKSLSGLSKRVIDVFEEYIQKRQHYVDLAQNDLYWVKRHDIRFLPKGHPKYPTRLYRLSDPPRWIFCLGNVDVLTTKPIVAVVGTRDASPTGMILAYSCGIQLARRNVVVLSGLAKGIDERAHAGVTDAFGQSIAVLGNGIYLSIGEDKELPQKILDTNGVIISEYFPNNVPSRTTFLRRNELQAALSEVVIPVECLSLESGTAATIRRAMSIETPLVGVSLEGSEAEENTRLTKEVLSRLNIKTFPIANNNSVEFWSHMGELIPYHDWSTDPTERQDRVIDYLVNVALNATRRVEFDLAAIERLHLKIKKALMGK